MIHDIRDREILEEVLIKKSIYRTFEKKKEKMKREIEEIEREIIEMINERNETDSVIGKRNIDERIVRLNRNKSERQNIVRKMETNVEEEKKISGPIIDRIKKSITGDIVLEEIDYMKYNEIVEGMIVFYDRVVEKIVDEGVVIGKIGSINEDLIRMEVEKREKVREGEMETIKRYYGVIEGMYNDYYDLDRSEGSEYNYIFNTIMEIIIVNVYNMVGVRIYQEIIKYFSGKMETEKIKEVLKDLRNNVVVDLDIMY